MVLRWPADLPPRIRVAGRFPHADTGFLPVHHTATHALHLYDYDCSMRFGRQQVQIRSGDVTLSPALGKTSYDLREPGKHLCVHFLPPSAGERARRPRAVARLPLVCRLGPRRDYAEYKLLEVIRLYSRGDQDPVAPCAASASLLELLLWLSGVGDAPAMPRSTRQAEQAVEQAANLIEDHLETPLSVPEIARRVGLSQNYLARLFRARFGRSIQSYLVLRRIEVARHLLAMSTISVKEIACRVGVPDLQHFNKQFRRQTGESPRGYRERVRGEC